MSDDLERLRNIELPELWQSAIVLHGETYIVNITSLIKSDTALRAEVEELRGLVRGLRKIYFDLPHAAREILDEEAPHAD